MSLTADKLDDWYIEEPDCQVEIRSRYEDGEDVMQWRDHYTLKLSRAFSKLSSHVPETRTIKSSFQARTYAKSKGVIGSLMSWSSGQKKFACTQDSAQIEDFANGKGTQYQTWEHYTDWEDIPVDTFMPAS